MAIQNRRGIYNNFDPSKLTPGEWAIVTSGDPQGTDGQSVYICFAAGKVKRMATFEDMATNIASATASVIAELTEEVDAATEAANAATSSANTAATNANSKASAANAATSRANAAAAAAEGIVLQAVPTMSATVKGGAKVGTGLEMSGTNSDVLQVSQALRDSISYTNTKSLITALDGFEKSSNFNVIKYGFGLVVAYLSIKVLEPISAGSTIAVADISAIAPNANAGGTLVAGYKGTAVASAGQKKVFVYTEEDIPQNKTIFVAITWTTAAQ